MSLKHIGNGYDSDMTDALNAFIRNATTEDVRVDFDAGTASLSGRVSSATARQAVEDLVKAHEGVEFVVNSLVVDEPAAVRPQPLA
jgi:osmotically-inducible protein OsmY